MRLVHLHCRIWVNGVLKFSQPRTITEGKAAMEALVREHFGLVEKFSRGRPKKHLIELEFLDEPDKNKRFFRIGTDTSLMVHPARIDHIDPEALN